MSTLIAGACEWATSLRLADIPADVRRLAIAQDMSSLAALHATHRHPVHHRLERALTKMGWEHQAAAAALTTMALDFDETAFAGHLGHACGLPILVCAAANGASGERALVAQVAAAEVAARLTASVTLGSARGQIAAHTHAAGAAVGFGVLLGLSADQLSTALSLALAQSRHVLLPAFMGSDAKFWVAAAPILDAANAVRAASDGAQGHPGLLEAAGGVLAELAEVPLPEAFSGYGERWHLRTLSIKAIPGCAYLTAAAEVAMELGPIDLAEVESVEAGVSILTIGMEAQSRPFIAGPATPVPALGFTTGYNVAAALETGGVDVEDLFGEPLSRDPRWRVAAALTLVHDVELTTTALAATAPVGQAIAWARERALPYLQGRGAGEDLARRVVAEARDAAEANLERPSKRIGARLKVILRGGRVLEGMRPAATGSCQESVDQRAALAERKLSTQLVARGMSDDTERLVAGYRGLADLTPAGLASLVSLHLESRSG
ncbi:MAG: hypothetical protein ACR2MY_09550 [Candidatus Dormibacteria bacterium]